MEPWIDIVVTKVVNTERGVSVNMERKSRDEEPSIVKEEGGDDGPL